MTYPSCKLTGSRIINYHLSKFWNNWAVYSTQHRLSQNAGRQKWNKD